jgi:2-hydroxycyclohexanecarboxyl-CoA dehydrogenase
MPTSSPSWPQDRSAVVTGGASARGIGRASARRLAAEGWHVAVLDVDAVAAEQCAKEITADFGVKAIGLYADIASSPAIDAAVCTVEAELPPVVAVVNNAGISSPTPFTELTEREWDEVFAVNMRGTFLVTQRLLDGMLLRRLGRVVSLSSISAERGGGTYSTVAYSASKAAVIGFTRALAREVGPHGVTVNCVAPGPIDTDIMGGPLTPARKRQMSDGMPVGRVGKAEEVAALIAFLAGPDAGYITAATYDINGGLQIS